MKSVFLFLMALCLSTANFAYAPQSELSRVGGFVFEKSIILPNAPSAPLVVTKGDIGLVLICVPGHKNIFSYLLVTNSLFGSFNDKIVLICHEGEIYPGYQTKLFLGIKMKKLLLALLCPFCFSHASAAQDLQSLMAEEASKDGVVLVRNDTHTPRVVQTEEIGKQLLCLSLDLKKASLVPVTKRAFPKGEATVLVRCKDGTLHFSRGYI